MSRRVQIQLRGGLAALTLALAGCGGGSKHPSASSAVVSPTTTPTTQAPPAAAQRSPLLTIFEADKQLHADPAGTIDLLSGWGVSIVRVFIPWGFVNGLGAIAPAPDATTPPAGFVATDPASYPASNWAIYDQIVRDAKARGMGVDFTIGPPPPLWARGSGDPGHPVHPQWRLSAADFGAFVTALGKRYSGSYTPAAASAPLPRVTLWSLWNEPNFGPMLAPQSADHGKLEVSPMLYRGLVDEGWKALGATGHRHDTILIGELAPRGIDVGTAPGQFGYMVPLRFLRALYCVDGSLHPLTGTFASARGCPTDAAGSARFAADHPGLFNATGFAVHPYPIGSPAKPTPNEPDFADLPALPKLESDLDAITATYGVKRQYPIWNTEFGFETNPPEKVFGTVTAALAATYLNESEYISWRDPRLRSFTQYLLVDAPNGQFATGLEYYGGMPKATLPAWRLPIWIPKQGGFGKGSPVEIWGCVRGAHAARMRTGRAQSVAIEFAAGAAGEAFRTLRTVTVSDAHGYFDVRLALPGSGRVRLKWTPPGDAPLVSRVVPVKAG